MIPEVEKLRRANPRLFQHKKSVEVAEKAFEYFEDQLRAKDLQIESYQKTLTDLEELKKHLELKR